MDSWVLWVVAACALAVGEMVTMGFYLAPFAVGALLASLGAGVGAGDGVAWAVFIVSSVGLLTVTRPIARRHRSEPPRLRSGTAALVGRTAVVLERVGDHTSGRVRIDGEEWTARSYEEDRVIEAGAKVQVMEIRGATALVSE